MGESPPGTQRHSSEYGVEELTKKRANSSNPKTSGDSQKRVPDRVAARSHAGDVAAVNMMTDDRDSKTAFSFDSGLTASIGVSPQSLADDYLIATFQEFRVLLFSIAYRMLGARIDAEDMVQETFLRWRRVAVKNIKNPRAFLVTVVTRLCINHLQSARVKREEYFGPWLPEPLLTGPAAGFPGIPGIDGSLSIAFLLLLERLSPIERAVFLLREAFDYTYDEIAGILTKSEANCRQIFRRAKQHLAEARPRFEVSNEQRQRLLQQFIETSSRGDMHGLLALLAEDTVLYTDGGGKATAVPNPIHGAEAVARFLFGARTKLLPPDIVRRFAEINGQPGVIAYHNGKVFGVLSLDVAEGQVRNIYIVRNPEKLARLPDLPPPPC
jgi:RNA polymerase sigma-70 factor, ECF subfamily